MKTTEAFLVLFGIAAFMFGVSCADWWIAQQLGVASFALVSLGAFALTVAGKVWWDARKLR